MWGLLVMLEAIFNLVIRSRQWVDTPAPISTRSCSSPVAPEGARAASASTAANLSISAGIGSESAG